MTQPAGYEAIKVHVESVAPGVQLGQPAAAPARRERIRTRFLNETVNDANPVRPLLPADPDRVVAYLETTGGDVYLCGSKGDAEQVPPNGSVLPTAFTAAWPIYGQGAVWIAQKTAATTCVVSASADYALPAE